MDVVGPPQHSCDRQREEKRCEPSTNRQPPRWSAHCCGIEFIAGQEEQQTESKFVKENNGLAYLDKAECMWSNNDTKAQEEDDFRDPETKQAHENRDDGSDSDDDCERA